MKRKKSMQARRGGRSEKRKSKIDAIVDDGIVQIRRTFAEFERGELHGSYGKRQILQSIYTVFRGWRDQDQLDRIRRRLTKRLSGQGTDSSAHLLELLIKVALPTVQPNVVTIWANAIRYGGAHHVRPFKLRSFFYVQGGLVRCARLFREEQEEWRAAKEIARLEAEARKAQMKRARGERRRAREKVPRGLLSLYDS